MICPKCKKEIDDNSTVCPICKTEFKKPVTDEKDKKSFFEKFKKSKDKKNVKLELNVDDSEKSKADKHNALVKKLKIALAVAVGVLIVAIILLIVVSVSTGKGEKTAAKIAAYVGADAPTVEEKLGIHFKDESTHKGLNRAVKFDYVVEADKTTKADGVKYPEWAVLITVDRKDKITQVKYCDFTTLESNIKGSHEDSTVNLDMYKKGESMSNVLDGTKLTPYSITYNVGTIEYLYKYYYTADNGDVQPMLLKAVSDVNNKYLYYTSTAVYPYDM